jgi:hypothetical protein
MSTFTPATKQANATMANVSKNTGTIHRYMKGGEGVPYDSPTTYDAEFDAISGNPMYYDTAGTTPVFTNLTKS